MVCHAFKCGTVLSFFIYNNGEVFSVLSSASVCSRYSDIINVFFM